MNPKFILTLLFITFLSYNSNAQWRPVGEGLLPDTQRVASISIVDASVVWGIAFYDRVPAPVPDTLIPFVFRTTNSGANWEVNAIEEVQGRICQDIYAVDDSTAWITTNGLVSDSLRGIFKTTDGGKTWEEKFDGPAGGGMIHFFDDSVGMAIHDQFLAFTYDSGENWDNVMPVNSIPFEPEERVFYTAANNAFTFVNDTIWFGTTHGRVFRSANRGTDWEVFDSPFETNDIIVSTAFRNANEGMIISYASQEQNVVSFMDSTQVALTFDGGETWEMADTLPDFKVNCITAVPSSDQQFIGASNGLSTLTNDTAQTWQHFSFRPYNSVEFFNGELGWVGNSQTSEDFPAIMYKWDGTVSSNKNIVHTNLPIQVFPNPFSNFFTLKMEELDFDKNKKNQLILDVFDVFGKKVLTKNISSPKEDIIFPNAPNGIYFYILKNSSNILANGRLILEK